MNSKPKASSMIKFGAAMLVLNLIGALIFKIVHDPVFVIIFLLGAVVWAHGIMIWAWIAEQEKDQ